MKNNEFDFDMVLPMEDMPFYYVNSGGDVICEAENERYVAKIVLCESADPTYITYKGKDYDLCCVHGNGYKELLPKEAQDYIREHDDWLCGKDSPFTDYSLGNDPDLVISDKELDEFVSSPFGGKRIAAEVEWDEKKITEDDFRAFMKFVLEHPHALEREDYRIDITGWADGHEEIWLSLKNKQADARDSEHNPNVWLIVVEDHHCGPEYFVASTQEKAEEMMLDILKKNYIDEDGCFYDERNRSMIRCAADHDWQGENDYVRIVKMELDSPYSVV